MKAQPGRKGYSLLEVLVALGLLVGVLSVTGAVFLSQAEAWRLQGRKVLRLQALRTALEAVARDIRLAGYPEAAVLARLLNNGWLPPAYIPARPFQEQPREAVTVVAGGTLPDGLMILALLPGETNPTNLLQAARAGDTALTLTLAAGEVADQYRPGDLLVVGQPPELAQVTGSSGRELRIDTDPILPGLQGLLRDQAAGTTVGELSLVSYAVFNDQNDPGGAAHEPGIPVLKRKINAGGFEPLAEQISGFKIRTLRPGNYEVLLEALPSLGPEGEAERLARSLRLTSGSGKRN
jgi:type II secretory pathway pseudopilin PulG